MTHDTTTTTHSKPKFRTKDLVLTGMMAAVLAVMSQISIPLPSGVPITMQTFAVALIGYTLGAWYGAAAVLIYLLAGLIGIPVFAGFAGGPGSFISLAGGFLYGFLPMAFCCGIQNKKKVLAIPFGLLGLALCHLLGVIQFSGLSGNFLPAAFLMVSVPYLVKDVLSVLAAWLVSLAVRKALARV